MGLFYGIVMDALGLDVLFSSDEVTAYHGPQRAAIRRRVPREQVSATVLSGRDVLPEAG